MKRELRKNMAGNYPYRQMFTKKHWLIMIYFIKYKKINYDVIF